MLQAAVSGVTAFTWLAGLWFAAPAFTRRDATIVDRIRTAVVIGVALPFMLGFAGLLFPIMLWIALAVLAFWRVIHVRPRMHAGEAALYATLGAVALVIWPQLVRPPLDGDTLAYHLPNAVAWAQQHSVWSTTASEWYYPPASELFASALVAIGARWSLPLGGAVAALLLTARLYSLARDTKAPRWSAAAIALSFVFTPLAAFQSGTLQNDLWLAAFFLEAVVAAGWATDALSVCALLKPFGFLEAAIAAAVSRRPPIAALLAAVPLALWVVRDSILLHSGPLVAVEPHPPYFSSIIAAHIVQAIAEAAHGFSASDWIALIWLVPVIAGYFHRTTRRVALAGTLVAVLYLFLPMAFRAWDVDYLANGSSLRFLLPACACGAAITAMLWARAPRIVSIAACAIAAYGAATVLDIFSNDRWTLDAPIVALLLVCVALVERRIRPLVTGLVCGMLLVIGAYQAQIRALSFYADWLAPGHAGVFEWLARNRPPRVVTLNVRSGAVEMSSPRTATIDGGQASDPCAFAASHNALLLVAFSNASSVPPHCGSVLYRDRSALVLDPVISSSGSRNAVEWLNSAAREKWRGRAIRP